MPTICIHCDSQSAIGKAQSNMYNGKSTHIRRKHNTIRQLISTGVIYINYVSLKDFGSANQMVKQRASRNIVEGNGIKTHRMISQ